MRFRAGLFLAVSLLGVTLSVSARAQTPELDAVARSVKPDESQTLVQGNLGTTVRASNADGRYLAGHVGGRLVMTGDTGLTDSTPYWIQGEGRLQVGGDRSRGGPVGGFKVALQAMMGPSMLAPGMEGCGLYGGGSAKVDYDLTSKLPDGEGQSQGQAQGGAEVGLQCRAQKFVAFAGGTGGFSAIRHWGLVNGASVAGGGAGGALRIAYDKRVFATVRFDRTYDGKGHAESLTLSLDYKPSPDAPVVVSGQAQGARLDAPGTPQESILATQGTVAVGVAF